MFAHNSTPDDIFFTNIHGGSIVFIGSRKNRYPVSPKIGDQIGIERELLHEDKIFHSFRTRIEEVKNLTLNEWFFPIHFPGAPNMPGALQLEALAQMLTVAITTLPGLKGKITHALSHTVRFKKEVLPGEKFEIFTEVISWKRGICKGRGTAYTNGDIACEADMVITIPDILEEYLPKKPVKK